VRHRHGFIVTHLFDPIQNIQIEIARNKVGTDPLNFMWAWLEFFTIQYLRNNR